MRFCGKCGNPLNKATKFCNHCGAPIPIYIPDNTLSSLKNDVEKLKSENERLEQEARALKLTINDKAEIGKEEQLRKESEWKLKEREYIEQLQKLKQGADLEKKLQEVSLYTEQLKAEYKEQQDLIDKIKSAKQTLQQEEAENVELKDRLAKNITLGSQTDVKQTSGQVGNKGKYLLLLFLLSIIVCGGAFIYVKYVMPNNFKIGIEYLKKGDWKIAEGYLKKALLDADNKKTAFILGRNLSNEERGHLQTWVTDIDKVNAINENIHSAFNSGGKVTPDDFLLLSEKFNELPVKELSETPLGGLNPVATIQPLTLLSDSLKLFAVQAMFNQKELLITDTAHQKIYYIHNFYIRCIDSILDEVKMDKDKSEISSLYNSLKSMRSEVLNQLIQKQEVTVQSTLINSAFNETKYSWGGDTKLKNDSADSWTWLSKACNAPDIKNIQSSSTYISEGGADYSIKNICDDDPRTAWIGGNPDNSIGEYINIINWNAAGNAIFILNGYQATLHDFEKYGRAKKLQLTIGDILICNIELLDKMGVQSFNPPDLFYSLLSQKGNEARFTIVDTYQGAKYKNIAISGLFTCLK